jgi:glucosylceramidase
MRRRDVRLTAVTVCAGVVLATWSAPAEASAPAAADRPVGQPAARVWLTTPDGALRLSDGGAVAFHRGGSANVTISVDPSRTYQRMDGFGASITDSSAAVLSTLDTDTRDRTMAALFSPRSGDGLSLLRQPMGASDFVSGDFYTYDDLPPGQTDYQLARFSIAHDRAQILPLLRQALALNPALKVIATPWSPPAWMKTNHSLIGGRLMTLPRHTRRTPGTLCGSSRSTRPPECRSTRSPRRTSRRTATPAATRAPICRCRRRSG